MRHLSLESHVRSERENLTKSDVLITENLVCDQNCQFNIDKFWQIPYLRAF